MSCAGNTWGVYGTTRKLVCEWKGEGGGWFREAMGKDGWSRTRNGTRSIGAWRPLQALWFLVRMKCKVIQMFWEDELYNPICALTWRLSRYSLIEWNRAQAGEKRLTKSWDVWEIKLKVRLFTNMKSEQNKIVGYGCIGHVVPREWSLFQSTTV